MAGFDMKEFVKIRKEKKVVRMRDVNPKSANLPIFFINNLTFKIRHFWGADCHIGFLVLQTK